MINSKKKWNRYELDVRKKYIEVWFKDCQTSRYANRKRDDEKVDLVETWPFNVQCKSYKNLSVGQVIQVLKQMPKDGNINIVHTKITWKWACVILSEKDWMKIVKEIIS